MPRVRNTTPLERREQRLGVANALLLPLARGARQAARLTRLLNGKHRVLHIDQARDYTVTVAVVDMPLGNPLVVALYTSTQTSRPLSPSQLAKRLQRLREAVEKLRGSLYTQADTVYMLYAPRGLTRGAARKAYKAGITVATKPIQLAKSLARFLKARYEKLRRRLAGKRVWGPIPALLYTLHELAKSLGADPQPPISLEQALHLAENGGHL